MTTCKQQTGISVTSITSVTSVTMQTVTSVAQTTNAQCPIVARNAVAS
jgi:hypothetical protein